jgi:hypothetical protein
MNPDGGIEAVALNNGLVEWKSIQADKPLAILNGKLVCLATGTDAGNELKFTTLDIATRGNKLSERTLPLPDKVIVSVDERIQSSFETSAYMKDGSVYLMWKYTAQPVKGYDQREDKTEDIRGPRTEKGLIQLKPDLEQIESIVADNIMAEIEIRPKSEFTEAQISRIKGRQFYSIDKKHIVGVERINSEDSWIKYKWTLYDLSGNEIGSFNSHFSYMPFYLKDSKLVFVTSPYAKRNGNEMIEEPLKIRSVSLDTGKEIWSKAVRDTKYRGAFPP